MIFLILVGFGILILCYALYLNSKLYKSIADQKVKRKYLVLLILIAAFIVGYLVLELVLFQNTQNNLELLVSIILFFGSMFVLIMSSASSDMITQLNDLNFNLEQKVIEKSDHLVKAQESLKARVAELEDLQDQLSQASKMTALGEMAGQIAHEINTPLAAIKMTTQTMQKIIDPCSDKEMKGAIDKNLSHILKITDQIAKIIRSLKRVFSDKDIKIIKSVSVSILLDDVTWLFSEKVRRAGVDFTVNNNLPEDTKLSCRSSEVIQILNNLLNNAFDAIKTHDTKAISLDLAEENSHILFKVTDSGPGIPDEIKKKLFESRFSTKKSGLGLGLGISLRIAKSHSGDLYLDDSCNETSFILKLPKV